MVRVAHQPALDGELRGPPRSRTPAPRTITNTTVRLIARVTVAGDAVRVRLDNAYGKRPLKIGRAYVGLRTRGAVARGRLEYARCCSTARRDGHDPAGRQRSQRPGAIKVLAMQDLAVSLYLPEADVKPSQHAGALVTSYAAAANAGDRSSVEVGRAVHRDHDHDAVAESHRCAVGVVSGAIVAFGDSITDGTCATLDAHDRWEDWLAVRLALEDERRGGRRPRRRCVNEGIGGNTVTREGLQPPPDSTPGIERLERDVLSHEGVTDVILFMGTNDIRRGASAAQVTGGMAQIVSRIKARG